MLMWIETFTKMSEKQQRQALLFFARLPLLIRLELFEKHKIVFYKLKQVHLDASSSLLSYCALIIVASSSRNDQQMLKSANFQNLTLDEILQLSLQQIQIFKHSKARKKQQYEQVMKYWSLIKTLKSQSMSFRDISEYLKKYHRLEISYSTIYQVYKKLGAKNGQ